MTRQEHFRALAYRTTLAQGPAWRPRPGMVPMTGFTIQKRRVTRLVSPVQARIWRACESTGLLAVRLVCVQPIQRPPTHPMHSYTYVRLRCTWTAGALAGWRG